MGNYEDDRRKLTLMFGSGDWEMYEHEQKHGTISTALPSYSSMSPPLTCPACGHVPTTPKQGGMVLIAKYPEKKDEWGGG